ncbi:MAG: hypothetical protein CMJ59_05525 [Planctomycetaceae bacterium]|nr:hypothetical protein [Planctomycetaceae bacterium]
MDGPGRITRRDLLQVGSLGLMGITLPDLLGRASAQGLRPGAAKSCILVFLDGGPAQQDMWDMKPSAPAEVRGAFSPISTSTPDIQICEHLPMVSKQMHHLALIRSVTHDVMVHSAATYYMLTGRHPKPKGALIIKDEPENFPPFGSVLSARRPLEDLPEFVHIPDIMWDAGHDLPGQRAGFLGSGFNPLVAGDPSVAHYGIPGLVLPQTVSSGRFQRRQRLLDLLDRSAGRRVDVKVFDELDSHKQKAFALLGTSRTRDAFDLEREKPEVRERYGLGLPAGQERKTGARNFGGLPHLGQSLLLTRRLIESGVRLVTVSTGRRRDSAWDGHLRHYPILKKSLLPYFDRGFSALLEDMADRDMFQDTLLVAMGEFGRTPKLGQITVGTADAGGRDHWSHCYTVMMGGAGIRGGAVYGSSDAHAAYPANHPVSPEDIAATIYYALGIDPKSQIVDPLGRPHTLALGKPITPLFS